MKKIRRITSHVGHARFLSEVEYGIGTIPRQDIPSPYDSPDHIVHIWQGQRIIVVETAHKQYDVFAVPDTMPLLPMDMDPELLTAIKSQLAD